MTSNEIWDAYLLEKEKGLEYDVIDSKSYLKEKYIKRMLKRGFVLKAGYSKAQSRPLGYRVNTKIAFEWIHPQLLLDLYPLPDCELVHRYGPMREQYLAKVEKEEKINEMPDEIIVESENKRNLIEDKSKSKE